MGLSTFNGLNLKELKRLERNYKRIGELINDLSFAYNPEKIVALKGLYRKTNLSEVFSTLRKVIRN